MVELFVNRIINDDQTSAIPFFDEKWSPESSDISYGHDIETSWLLHEAAKLIDDTDLLHTVETISLNVAKYVKNHGVDNNGGIFNKGNSNGVIDHSKDWWPQAEGVVGFLNAYQISGNSEFLNTAERVWDFINEFMIDKTNGEWHEKVNREGEPFKLDKVRSWKCPYHNGRAALEVLQRVEALLEKSAYA
jgi:mannobiose 2-epimerase